MLIRPKNIILKDNQSLILKSPLPDDAENLLNHLQKIFGQSYRNMNHPKDHWDSFPVEDEKKILTDFTSATNKFMISVFSEERIIGNLVCFAMGGQFLMHNGRIGMGIEEEFHNLGVGTALLNYAIEIARSKGFSRLELNVRTFNTAGIALYEKIGFQKVGRLQKVAFIDGQFCDEFMYELLVTVA